MIIDIVFALLIFFAVLKGLSKGLIVALFSILSFIAGLAAALKLSAIVAAKLSLTVNASYKWMPAISFLLVFIVVVILVRLGGKMIEKIFKIAFLGWINKICGVLLYTLLYSILFSIFLFYAVQLNFIKQPTISASYTYAYIQPLGPKVMDSLGSVIPIFKDMFAQLQKFFGSLQ